MRRTRSLLHIVCLEQSPLTTVTESPQRSSVQRSRYIALAMKRREMIRPRRSNGSSPRGPARRIQGAVSRRHGRGAQSSLRDREPSKSPGILNESRSRRFWMRLAKKRQTIVVSRLEGGGGGIQRINLTQPFPTTFPRLRLFVPCSSC